MAIHLYLVRHGQTYFNLYNRLQGWSNSPLTENGKNDAVKAGEKLADVKFDAAFCSDTTRAQQTLDMILQRNVAARFSKLEPSVHMEFREQFYGYFEGRDMNEAWWAAGAPHGAYSYAEILKKFGPYATKDFLKEADPFHHAENDDEYWNRIKRGFGIIAKSRSVHDESNVLLISHGNTLLSLIQRFKDSAPADIDCAKRPANGSITRIDFNLHAKSFDESMAIVGYNE
ncbi:histidine phosphatase family protein [Alloscardovia venturai]|uniref:Histidine phosphatase family protein n=1 Tax=Alloscardovia venturai TaxID=1769421 RepID=A0ABW2Y462_9BIFI